MHALVLLLQLTPLRMLWEGDRHGDYGARGYVVRLVLQRVESVYEAGAAL